MMRKMKREASKPATRRCPKCQGTGQLEMTGEYADTLVLLRQQIKETTGIALAEMAGINPTAMNNRLVWLEREGLAVGRRYGRSRFWKAT